MFDFKAYISGEALEAVGPWHEHDRRELRARKRFALERDDHGYFSLELRSGRRFG